MVKFALTTSLLALSSFVSASPAPAKTEVSLESHFRLLTEQWDFEDIGQYTLYNNLFGSKQSGTSGQQSTQAFAINNDGTIISWRTQYSWMGNPGNVKSYANVALKNDFNKQLRNIDKIPTTWRWTYHHAASALAANVAYDLWLSKVSNSGTANKDSTVEVMIWLSDRGAEPAGFQLDPIGGLWWNLFKGKVETWDVYSFVAAVEQRTYHADLRPFFTYLNKEHGVSLNQYLVGLQAGTEPFIEYATLATLAYTAAIN